jgi:uncharacterized membrane protein YjjP (DUF1212 family)
VNESKRDQDLARRNLRTALWLALLAFGFVAAFFWSMSHRGG